MELNCSDRQQLESEDFSPTSDAYLIGVKHALIGESPHVKWKGRDSWLKPRKGDDYIHGELYQKLNKKKNQ